MISAGAGLFVVVVVVVVCLFVLSERILRVCVSQSHRSSRYPCIYKHEIIFQVKDTMDTHWNNTGTVTRAIQSEFRENIRIMHLKTIFLA